MIKGIATPKTIMPNNSGPEIVDKIKDLLRSQLSLWNSHILRHRGMNLTLQRRIENNLDKTKIVLALRLRHVERLLGYIQHSNPYKKDAKDELQTYWTAILPEIKEVLKNYKDINTAMKSEQRFEDLQIPEILEIHAKPQPVPEPDTMSRITTLSNATQLTNASTKTRSILRGMQNIKSPTRRPKSRN